MSTRTPGVLQIGDVAERTGLSLRAVRHDEEVGLLPTAERSPGGFRLSTEAAVQRLLVIKQTKVLDLSLEQVRELVDVLDELSAGPSPDRRRELEVVLTGCAELVGERTGWLRERLAGAEDLQRALTDLLP